MENCAGTVFLPKNCERKLRETAKLQQTFWTELHYDVSYMVFLVGFLFLSLAAAQVSNPAREPATNHDDRGPQPIYRVEVVARTIKAVNYGHRTIPTKVDLKGTVLAPEARGEARVESKRGAVEIEVQVSRLDAPSRFGNEYLTYVLWAITPEGRSPISANSSSIPATRASTRCLSDLQAFALIVTAEPISLSPSLATSL